MTITKTSPLGRESMAFQDKMRKYHAEIERMVYAAEVLCPHTANLGSIQKCQEPCLFRTSWCTLYTIRKTLGDHVKQDDIPEAKNEQD
jgi:hypothetical protein